MRIRDRHARSKAVERDLTRLADGTLEPSRREHAERLVARSPDLQARLDEQRRAVAAAREVAWREHAPLALRLSRPVPSPPRRRSLVLGAGLTGAAGALVWLLAAVGGSQAGLTVAQAAAVAVRPATVAVAEPGDDQVILPRVRAAGLPFPYWEDHFDWSATGARTDRIAGRTLTTVYYRRGRQTIAYTIVSGQALGAGVQTKTSSGGRQVVTWLRRGHTCVLSGHNISTAVLVRLAGWRGHGRIPY